MQNYRAMKKKPSRGGGGSSIPEKDKSNPSNGLPVRSADSSFLKENDRLTSSASNDSRRHARSNATSRSDRSLNDSGMSDRRVVSNGSWNSNAGNNTDRRVASNASMNAADNDRGVRRPPRTNALLPQDMPRTKPVGPSVDMQEPEPTPSTNQYDLIWHQGDLALQFSLNAKHRIAICQIETNLPKETTAGLASASLGDVLVALNWEDVTALSPGDVQRRLNHADLPMTLTFQSLSQQPAISRLKRAPSLSRMPPLQANEFEAVWTSGRLGVVIACDAAGRPVVREYAKEASTDPGVSEIQPKDELIFVNDIAVGEIGYDQAIAALRHAQKPVLLRFRRDAEGGQPRRQRELAPTSGRPSHPPQPPQPGKPSHGRSSSPKIDTYAVVWREGPLGLVLKKNDVDDIYIKELKKKGVALLHQAIMSEGDVLVSITGVLTKSLGFTGTVDFLKAVQKPVELVFQPIKQTAGQQEHTHRRESSVAVSNDVAAKYMTSRSSKHIPSATATQTYDVIWHRGKLALSLRYASSNRTVIRKITSGDLETTANVEAAAVGDVLVAINWDDMTSAPYEHVVARLKERDFPLTLTFKRSTSDQTTSQMLPPGEFQVTWRDGKLGVRIHCDPDGRAMVRERTEPTTDPDLAQIQAGDELAFVNGLRVRTIGYSDALVEMKKPKPIQLRFRRRRVSSSTRLDTATPPSAPASALEPAEVDLDSVYPSVESPRQSLAVAAAVQDEMYSVDWTGGSLGISLRMNDQSEIFIAQLTGRGLALECPEMAVGDLLVGVMGVPTTPLGLAGTVDFLKCIQKPAVLTFLRRTSNALPPQEMPAKDGAQTPVLESGPLAPEPPLSPPPLVVSAPPKPPLSPPPLVVSAPPETLPSLPSPLPTTEDKAEHSSWSFARDSSLDHGSMPLSPSNQLNISLGASSSRTGQIVMSPHEVPDRTTPPETPPMTLLQRPVSTPPQLMLSPLQHVSDPVVSPQISFNEPTPQSTSIVVSQSANTTSSSAWGQEPATPPGTPPTQSMMEPYFTYADPTQPPSALVLPSTPALPPAAQQQTPPPTLLRTEPPSVGAIEPPAAAFAAPVGTTILPTAGTPPITPPPSTSSLPPMPTLDLSNPPDVSSPRDVYFDDRGASIADLPDFPRDTTFSEDSFAYKLPRHDRVFEVPYTDVSSQDLTQTPSFEYDRAHRNDADGGEYGYEVVESEFSSPRELPTPPSTSSVEWDIARENLTPTHHTPTAATSMVPLYGCQMSTSQSDASSLDSLDLSDYQSSSGSFSSSSAADILSSRSMTIDFLPGHAPLRRSHSDSHYATATTAAANAAIPPHLSTVSLEDDDVDIDDIDDDDSIQEDYSTSAPEDMPILSTSSRSMSARSISSVSTPPPSTHATAADRDSTTNDPKTLYSILWRGGPLGLAIKRNKNDEISVKALTGGGLAGNSDIIQPRDVLVQCGTTIVQYSTLPETSRVLKHAKTPVSLVFLRRQQQTARHSGASSASVPTLDMSTSSYDNALGGIFGGGSSSSSVSDGLLDPATPRRGSIYMPKRLTSSNKHSTVYSIVWEGGPLGIAVTKNSDDENCVMRLTGDGLAAQSTIIRVGDVLMAAGDVQVSKVSLTAAMHVIQLARKPTFLVFRRMGDDEDV
ncbi:hypothetical protein B5M09_002334 [Aphanomyces astaci]|uniref:PDZ domain-containing protein n=1 Tax=Aphanomyces astaci TaxID=112090 RepID=A0A3R7WAC9_APHAT|nr:hypothetical protein B5M09_002334 [Aphanomyces astaci]